MPICPNCQTEQTRRVSDSCPNCFARVASFKMDDGTVLWVREGEKKPNVQLAEYWMEKLSERLTKDQGRRVVFSLHPMKQASTYRKELAWAENFLMQADWDLDLAKRTLSGIIDKWFRPLASLSWAANEYPVALAVARSTVEDDTPTSKDITRKRLEAMEDVWS